MDVDSPLINHLHTNMLFVPQVIRLAHENSSKEETQFHGMWFFKWSLENWRKRKVVFQDDKKNIEQKPPKTKKRDWGY